MLHIYCAEQVLYAALDMDDSLGDLRRQIAYGESTALSALPLIFYTNLKSPCPEQKKTTLTTSVRPWEGTAVDCFR
eukprot:COSAG03_NODE_104_length_12717_cov_48.683547_5_plen_76_part_00